MTLIGPISPVSHFEPTTSLDDELCASPIRQHAHTSVAALPVDKISSYDEEENNAKKLKLPETAALKFYTPTTPQLCSPHLVNKTIEPAQKRMETWKAELNADTKPVKEEHSQKLISDSDFVIDAAFFKGIADARALLNQAVILAQKDVMKLQELCRKLYKDKGSIQDEIAKRAIISDALEWVRVGAVSALVGFSTIAFGVSIATSIVTAGLSLVVIGVVVAVLAAIATAVSGVTQGTNEIVKMQMREKQGVVENMRTESELMQGDIEKRIRETTEAIKQIATLWEISVRIGKARASVRIF